MTIPKFKTQGGVETGDLVLLRDEGLVPRLKWPMGRIVEVFKGKDGIVRSVKLKTSRGTIVRPIQRLYNLEIPREVSEVLPGGSVVASDDHVTVDSVEQGDSLSENRSIAVHRPRRSPKPVVKYDA